MRDVRHCLTFVTNSSNPEQAERRPIGYGKKRIVTNNVSSSVIISIVSDGRKVVQSGGFFVVGWVVQTPLRGRDFHGEGFREGHGALESLVVWHGLDDVFHHHLVCVGYEVVVCPSSWLRGTLIVPVDVLVISWKTMVT